MRRQVLFVALTFVVLSPLVLVARNQDGSFRPVWAGEKPRPTAPTSEEGTGMADILYVDVADAGDATYNGRYYPAGEYNGKPYYAKAGGALYLSWQSASNMWELAPGPGLAPDYGGATGQTELPANPWSPIAGLSPAPTLTVTVDTGGGGDTGSAVNVDITAPHVNLGYQAGVSHFVATGDAGVIYRKTGSTWAEFATTDLLTEPGPMAYFRNRLFVGGNGPELYCWDFLGDIWQVYKTFDDLTSITRLVAYGGALLVFGVGPTAIHALRINSYHLTGRYIDEVGYQTTEWVKV